MSEEIVHLSKLQIRESLPIIRQSGPHNLADSINYKI